MPTQTIRNWPEIECEGVDMREQPKKRGKHIRKYSILYLAGKLIKALILTASFLVIMAAVGNAIELIARI